MQRRSSEANEPEGTRPAIQVDGVTLGYGDHVVLEDVSFDVREGEAFAILGPSGCGKSTLMKALIGLLEAYGGRICVEDIEVTDADLDSKDLHHELSRHIGVLFQSTALLGNLTVGENVALSLEEHTRLPRSLTDRTVQLALDLVGLGDSGDAMPSELSGGMLRRAGLARAMAFNPRVLFCDEPSAGLDPITAREVDLVLHELNRDLGVTLVIITHELGSVQNLADRCLMLSDEDKGVVAIGTLDEVRQSDDPRVQSFFKRRIDKDGDRHEGEGAS